jgi:GT2 family glycosyltransferase/glycosyltransferase involved in cell wall biosynthesis
LFKRYERRHRAITARGFRLSGVRGHVDRVRLDGTRLTVTGWTAGDRVTLTTPAGEASGAPSILRQDVAEAHGLPLQTGFELTAPHGPGVFTLTVEAGGDAHVQTRSPIPRGQLWAARLHLGARFGAALLGVVPSIIRAVFHHDAAARDRVKSALGLDLITEAGRLDPAFFAVPDPSAAPPPEGETITILLPVYNAFGLVQQALARVVAHTDLPWHLVVIEDCSSDPEIRPWLRDWVAGEPRAEMIENAENLGFIGAVNKGLARATALGHHVVLLNTDAFVPEGWASRLMRPIFSDPAIATVTPLSNDAEIFTTPLICDPVVLPEGLGDALDRVARGLNPAHWPVTPTGVGFCMGLNLAFLDRLPALDPGFGRGYGEEVDWCQKARALGGRHVAQPGLFVEHHGGESFGQAEKQALILRNNLTIAKRYPGYDEEVQGFIATDPLVTARLALAIAWAAGQGGEIPVYLAHSLGGGAENYLQKRIADAQDEGLPAALILRVGGGLRWQLELASARGVVAGATDDLALITRLLAPVKHRRIIYSCGVGDRDPVTLPDVLQELRGADGALEVLVHDYFPLSPSYTLLDADGVYRGPLDGPRTDAAHQARRGDGSSVGLEAWQAAWGGLLARADVITAFSEDSRKQVLAAYPQVAPALRVQPHGLVQAIPGILPAEGRRRVIGVLGAIGHQKGAAVLADMGRRLGRKAPMGLVIVGDVDPAYMPPAHVPVHGAYKIAELPRLVAQYGITDWLIPSIWPETFSYTTHECLATGMPVYAFGIGAQGDAVAAAPNGHVIPFTPGGDLAGAVLAAIG